MTRRPITAIALFVVAISGATIGRAQEPPWYTRIVQDGSLSGYQHGEYPSLGPNTHIGADIGAECGKSDVKAWAPGRVIDVIGQKGDRNFSSLGYFLLIDHGHSSVDGKRYVTAYLHLASRPSNSRLGRIGIGDRLDGGEPIGKVGDTGKADGCHVHFEIRHFTDRIFNWGTTVNIYGPADVRKDAAFLSNWSNPSTTKFRELSAASPIVPTGDNKFVVQSVANVRDLPSTSDGLVIEELQPGELIDGEIVTGSGPSDQWIHLTGQDGFVWAGNVKPFSSVATISPQTVSVSTSNPNQRPTYQSTYKNTRADVANGTVQLPEPSIPVEDEIPCSEDEERLIRNISGRKIQCFGLLNLGGFTYILAANWLMSEEDPGLFQLVQSGPHGDRAIGSIAAVNGGYLLPIITKSGNFELLSVAESDGSKGGNGLPYLRYRIEKDRLRQVPTNLFADGTSPVDRNREVLRRVLDQQAERPSLGQRLASLVQPTARSSSRGSARTSERLPRGRASNDRATDARLQICARIEWGGLIENIADLFMCDEAKAISVLAEGRRVVFHAGDLSFSQGKVIVSMRQNTSMRSEAIDRLQRDIDWADWFDVTQSVESRITCLFDGAAIKTGTDQVVFAKLETYSDSRIVLNCSL